MGKILVTGGCGYVGKYLVSLLSEDYKVAVYDNITYEPHYLDEYEFYYGDITDYDRYLEVLEEFKPDIVCSLAALVGDPCCQANPELAKEINEDSVKWLCENYKGKIIHLSTCSIFGINNNLITEDTKPNPISVYAQTKLNSEKYVLDNGGLVLRLGTLYGKTSSRPRLDLVVNIFATMCALGQDLIVTGKEAWRPLLHVKDVSHAIKNAIWRDLSGAYNLVDKNYQIGEIAQKVVDICGTGNIIYQNLPPQDLRNYKVDNTKCSSFFTPQFSLEDGVLEIYKMVKENRIKSPFSPLYHNGKFAYEHLQRISQSG